MKVFVSGLSSVETTLAVRGFPVTYYPVDYPFFGISTEIAGSGFRIARNMKALGDDVEFFTLIGDDVNGARILEGIGAAGLSDALVRKNLGDTVESVALQETPFGRRQVYCDLKDVQDAVVEPEPFRGIMSEADLCVLCNVNYNRSLIGVAKSLGKKIATDVQNLTDIRDTFNAEFIDSADILFLSDEGASTPPAEFLAALAGSCSAEIIVMGLAEEGALLFERGTGMTYRLRAADVGSVITAGAGAALMSGFLHYYGRFGAVDALKRAEVYAALKLAAASSGGVDPTEAQIEEKLATVVF